MTHKILPRLWARYVQAHFVHGIGWGVCTREVSGTTSVWKPRSCAAHSPVNQHHVSQIALGLIDVTIEILLNYC
jgi:hypothetical protein